MRLQSAWLNLAGLATEVPKLRQREGTHVRPGPHRHHILITGSHYFYNLVKNNTCTTSSMIIFRFLGLFRRKWLVFYHIW